MNTRTNPNPKVAGFRLASITFFALALGMLANTLEPSVLGHKMIELVPEGKNTALGFTTFAGLIVAVLWQPIVGALSDRTRSPWGRRIPFLIIGTIGVVASLYLIALAPLFLFVVIGTLAIQVASNTVQGPWQALIPDHVPRWQRGTASGMKSAFEILSFVLGRRISGYLVADGNVIGAVSVAAFVYVLALVLTIVAVKGGDKPRNEAPQTSVRKALATTFSVDFKAHPAFKWWFLNRFLFWSGFIALNTFLLFFIIDVVKMGEAEAQRLVADLTTILGLALLIVTLPAGWVADRVGRRPLVVIAGLLSTLGIVSVLIFRSRSLLIAAGILIGLGAGIFLSANWALITDIVPEREAARYLGIANIASAGGSAVARFLGGALIDPINRLVGDPAAGYYGLYTLAGLAFLVGTWAILRMPIDPENNSSGPSSLGDIPSI